MGECIMLFSATTTPLPTHRSMLHLPQHPPLPLQRAPRLWRRRWRCGLRSWSRRCLLPKRRRRRGATRRSAGAAGTNG